MMLWVTSEATAPAMKLAAPAACVSFAEILSANGVATLFMASRVVKYTCSSTAGQALDAGASTAVGDDHMLVNSIHGEHLTDVC